MGDEEEIVLAGPDALIASVEAELTEPWLVPEVMRAKPHGSLYLKVLGRRGAVEGPAPSCSRMGSPLMSNDGCMIPGFGRILFVPCVGRCIASGDIPGNIEGPSAVTAGADAPVEAIYANADGTYLDETS